MVRSPAPDRELLCVRCGRDRTSLPNGTHASPTSATSSNIPAAGYHPFINGDDMDSDEAVQETGGMEVDRTTAAIQTTLTDCISPF
jgi:hypothetical protein